MSTVPDLLNAAAAKFGLYSQDRALDPSATTLMLSGLQQLLDSLANWQGWAYQITSESLPLVGGVADYSSTLLAAGRPLKVENATVVLSSVTYALAIYPYDRYSDISYKPVSSIPTAMYPEMGFPNATFHFWPIPFGPMTALLDCRRPVTGTLTLGTTLSLPPGYERAIVHTLAVEMAPSFGSETSPATQDIARKSLAALKRTNYQPPIMDTGLDATTPPADAFIYKGF